MSGKYDEAIATHEDGRELGPEDWPAISDYEYLAAARSREMRRARIRLAIVLSIGLLAAGYALWVNFHAPDYARRLVEMERAR